MALRRGWKWDGANSRLVLYADGTEVARFEDGKLAFHGSTAVNAADAYTQTYSTANRTVANPTATAPAACAALTFDESTAWNGSDVHPALSDAEEIQADDAALKTAVDANNTAIDALIADNLDLRQAVTALIDDLQQIGLVG